MYLFCFQTFIQVLSIVCVNRPVCACIEYQICCACIFCSHIYPFSFTVNRQIHHIVFVSQEISLNRKKMFNCQCCLISRVGLILNLYQVCVRNIFTFRQNTYCSLNTKFFLKFYTFTSYVKCTNTIHMQNKVTLKFVSLHS